MPRTTKTLVKTAPQPLAASIAPPAPPAVIQSFNGIFTEQQVALVKRTICKGASDDELQLFLAVCQRTGLDPFARQIYSIARRTKDESGKWVETRSIQTGIDGFRVIAEKTGEVDGQEGPFWCAEDGAWKEVWLDPKLPPVAAKVVVHRKGARFPFVGVARFESYAQYYKDGSDWKLTAMWWRMGDVMIAKCAEALALRKAFPQKLGELRTTDEMMQAENPEGRLQDTAHPEERLKAEVEKNGGKVIDIKPEPEPEKKPADETAKLLDVECHIGNAGGPMLGKKVREMVPKVIKVLHDDWLVKLAEKPLNKDARLRDAVLARKAIMEADGTWHKDAPETPAKGPEAQTTAPEPQKGSKAAKNAAAVPSWREVVVHFGKPEVKGKTLGALADGANGASFLENCYIYGIPRAGKTAEDGAFIRGVTEACEELKIIDEAKQRRQDFIFKTIEISTDSRVVNAALIKAEILNEGKTVAEMTDAEITFWLNGWEKAKETGVITV